MRLFILGMLISGLMGSCIDENEIINHDPSVTIRFSKDTVLFDTVFTTIGSITRRVKIYNDAENAVNISKIYLAQGMGSPYTLTLNGERGKNFTDQLLLGEDSLQLLVDVLIDPGNLNLPFIVRDSVVFDVNTNQQHVKLISWGQDAHFFSDSILACDVTWTNDKPYVIFNSILVDSLCKLSIQKGVRVYNHFGSSIFVKGSIDVQGEPEDRVVFRNDRLDEGFRDAPGQWRGIYFLEGSRNNVIRNAEIRNAVYGIWLGTPDEDNDPDLVLENAIIENISRTGLIAFTSDLSAHNLLINNCGEYCLGNFAGGNYIYRHCTMANFPFQFFKELPVASFADNIILDDQSSIIESINVELTNTIIWGNLDDEIELNNGGGAQFTFVTQHNILKTTLSELGINNNLINNDPKFIDPPNANYRLDSLSPAIDAGTDVMITTDLDGNARVADPDIGAFERIE